ncbi:hypothetical protein ACKVMT_05550 [Halobacteriales archaeon Cl-PHB]
MAQAMSSATAESTDDRGGEPSTASTTVAVPADESSYPLAEDELFHVLQNERRRAVLRFLDGTDETVEMRAIAEQVAAWEHDTTVQQLDSDQRQRVYIALYQSHLETLEDAGIVEYEKSRGNVRLTDLGQEVATYMAGVDDSNGADDWRSGSLDYIAAAVLSLLLLGGTATGVLGLAALSSITVSVLTVVLFTSVTVGRVAADAA